MTRIFRVLFVKTNPKRRTARDVVADVTTATIEDAVADVAMIEDPTNCQRLQTLVSVKRKRNRHLQTRLLHRRLYRLKLQQKIMLSNQLNKTAKGGACHVNAKAC